MIIPGLTEARLRALRAGPPGTQVARLDDPDLAHLLNELRRRPPDEDSEAWARGRHARACVRGVLRTQLAELSGAVAGLVRASTAGVALPDLADDEAVLAGHGVPLPLSSVESSEAILTADLARWRQESTREAARTWAARVGYQLLARVLGPDVDPEDACGWLERHAADEAAWTALALVASLATAELPLEVGEIARTVEVNETVDRDGFVVQLRRVRIGRDGMQIETAVTVPTPGTSLTGRLRGGRSSEPALFWEDGFTQLIDDQGHEYLAGRTSHGAPSDHAGRRTTIVVQSFFPALAAGARTIGLRSPGHQHIRPRPEPADPLQVEAVREPIALVVPVGD